MRIKQIHSTLVILLILVSGSKPIFGQNSWCGTRITETQMRLERERAAREFYRPQAPQLNRPIWIPLTIHIVRRTNGADGLTLQSLNLALTDLNQKFLQMGVQFYQYGNIDYINSDYFYDSPDSRAIRDELRQVNPVANTINIYYTKIPGGLCGESTFTSDNPQGIVMDIDSCNGVTDPPAVLAHEVGHYFDLYHTFHTGFGVECPNGSNCSTTGDLVCDTPADPNLDFNVNEACAWTGSAAPPAGCGSTPYAPSTINLMAYSRVTCMSQFTTGQNTKALATLVLFNGGRHNLLVNISRYVAPDGDLNSGCGYAVPCRTLQRAIQIANPGDHIFMLSGSYPTAIGIFNKSIFARKWNTDAGIVSFGQ